MSQMLSNPNNQFQSQAPLSTCQCVQCATQLSYPSDSQLIACPKCGTTQNPLDLSFGLGTSGVSTYVNCIGCQTLLSHPPGSMTIQCPKCLMVMDLPRVDVNYNSNGSVSTEQHKKTKKKRKDPQAPKRASNAYMVFCKQRRPQLKAERPDLPFGKLGAALGDMWRLMSVEEKRPYEDAACLLREKFKNQMTQYNNKHSFSQCFQQPHKYSLNNFNQPIPNNLHILPIQTDNANQPIHHSPLTHSESDSGTAVSASASHSQSQSHDEFENKLNQLTDVAQFIQQAKQHTINNPNAEQQQLQQQQQPSQKTEPFQPKPSHTYNSDNQHTQHSTHNVHTTHEQTQATLPTPIH